MKAVIRVSPVAILATLLAAVPAFAADWTEYRAGPMRVIANAGDGNARRLITEMEQIRWVLGGMIGANARGHADLGAIWPITLVLFDSDKDRAAYQLATPFIEGGSANLSTTPSPAWRSDIVRQLIESNSGRMPQEVETALADLFATIEVRTTRVAIGAPVPGLSFARNREWARLHMLATQPEYAGRFRVYLANLAGGDLQVAAFNTYGVSATEIDRKMNEYSQRASLQAVEVFGAAINPNEEFYERRLTQAEVDTLMSELKAGGKTFPPDSPRGLVAQGTRDSLYKAIEANPKWGEPHARIAALMANPKDRIAPLTKATELEPRNIAYWEALARAQIASNMYAEASKSWLGAEKAAGTADERARIRRERAAIEEQRVDAELAAQRAAKDEAEKDLRRVIAESEARVKAAEAAANRENSRNAKLTPGQAPAKFEDVFKGVTVTGRLVEVECVDSVLKLNVQVTNAPMVVVLVQKNPEKDGKPVFTCGPISPSRRIELTHDGKADMRWNTVGEVDTFDLK
jgi:hypothetical protein